MAGFKDMFGRVREALFPSRKAPVQTTTQAGQVRDRKYGGSTKAMASAYGVSPPHRPALDRRHPTPRQAAGQAAPGRCRGTDHRARP